jgi:hypothetical protein
MLLAAPATLFAIAIVAGCGGGDDDAETSAQATTQAQQGRDSGQAQSGGSQRRQQQDERRGGGGAQSGPTDVNPDGENPPSAKQLGIVAGGDNSLQTFGEDAEGEEREEVVSAMSAYFAALAEGGIEAACPYLVASFRSGGQEGQDAGSGDCAALARLLSGGPKGALVAEARTGSRSTILSVRVEDERAIVMLRTARGELAYFTMQREDGEWRATVPTVTVLP